MLKSSIKLSLLSLHKPTGIEKNPEGLRRHAEET
jgi:hypothetical protein